MTRWRYASLLVTPLGFALSVYLTNRFFQNSQGSGILTARMGSVTVQGCVSTGHVQHGVYVSEGGDHLRIGGDGRSELGALQRHRGVHSGADGGLQ